MPTVSECYCYYVYYVLVFFCGDYVFSHSVLCCGVMNVNKNKMMMCCYAEFLMFVWLVLIIIEMQ